ncbi:MAG: hypothetical protein Q9220_005432 [cf. Caloplaca sp. 1 TL-2023]
MSSTENDHERETAEVSAEQTAIDGSVGSDTETTKNLISDPASKDHTENPHHARSNSVNVKKPATFKAVSVTKNFLAKAGTTTAPAVKGPGDNGVEPGTNPVNNALPPPRPRLVAKPASGHQASTSKSSASAFRNGGSSGPDPLQVWNRNRAAPPTAPKHFTDEELKQQYGIHLATRLQADGDGKEAKWADIDDDEDDWAPETIEWNDGTKITLADSNAAAAFAEEQAAAQALKEKQEAEAKAKAAQPKTSTTVGPNATVLKLGQAGQAKGGLVLKAPMEKQTLVAKPAAPAPVKSPWASIPTVDKVPPVPINPPLQVSRQRPQQIEQQRPDMISPPTSAAMEIAADSFSRARRDSPNAPPGQLFNSQSGQYEPVSSGRRGSVRKDQNFRPPAVLQRPSQSDSRRPAEPSAAFQSPRTGGPQEVGIWTRRGSSTAGGNSGLLGRDRSMNKDVEVLGMPDELLQQRRDSQPLRSPALSNQHQLIDTGSSAASPQQQKASPMAQPATLRPNDDKEAERNMAQEREAQRKIMLEKRETAIKRRAEQEAKEEAEKRERIRIKMQNLGLEPVPEKDTSKSRVPPVTETEIKSKPQAKEEKSNLPNEEPMLAAPSKEDQVATVPRSPPKPPLPDASGEPKQYGMMKVHGHPLTNGVLSQESKVMPDRPRQPAQSPEEVSLSRKAPEQAVKLPETVINPPSEPPMVNGDVAVKLPDGRTGQVAHEPVKPQPKSSRQQVWSSHPEDVDPYKGWNNNSVSTNSIVGGNLWGPPSNHKALGNGTFDQSVQRPQSRQYPYQEQLRSPALLPIGPPKQAQRPRQSPEAARAPETTSMPLLEDMQTVPSFPTDPSGKPPMSGVSIAAQAPDAQFLQSALQHRPSAAPQTISSLPGRALGDDQVKSTLAAWDDFHLTSAREAEERRRQHAQKEASRFAEEARTGIRQVPQLAPMQETWRQTSDQSGQRETINITKRQTHQQASSMQQVPVDLRQPPFTAEPNVLPPSQALRNSRFFPAHGQSLQAYNSRAVSLPIGFPRQSSPPPPDADSHPAYVREGRPLVNLPISKPRPTVRLPPSTVTPTQSPIPAHVSTVPLRAILQPLVNNPSWQDRFNGLLGVVTKKPSPERNIAQLVDFSASTRIPLDLPGEMSLASVSLPPTVDGSASLQYPAGVASGDVEAENLLFDDRSFGSIPQISLPTSAPEGVGFVTATKPRRQTRTLRPVESESRRVFEPDVRVSQVAEGILIDISIPGSSKVTRTLSRGNSQIGSQASASMSSGSQRPQRHVSNNARPSRGVPRPRDSSNQHSGGMKAPQGAVAQRQNAPAKAASHLRGSQRDGNQREPKPNWYYNGPNMNGKTGVLV